MATTTQTYGIILPIQHGEQGYFNQSYTVLDQIASNLSMLLKTKKGERRMNPEFGSGLWNVLFENITDDIIPIVESTIRRDIKKWMPYVEVKAVDVSSADNAPNQLNVSVQYTVPSVGATNQQTLQVAMNTNGQL